MPRKAAAATGTAEVEAEAKECVGGDDAESGVNDQEVQGLVEFSPRRIQVLKSEGGLRNRRGPMTKSKGVGTCANLFEEMHTLTKSWRCCPEWQSLTFPGQRNSGTSLGPLTLDSWEGERKLDVGTKKQFAAPTGWSEMLRLIGMLR